MNNTPINQYGSSEDFNTAVLECCAKPAGDPQRIIILLSRGGASIAPLPRGPVVVADAMQFGGEEISSITRLVNRTRAVPVLRVTEEAWLSWHLLWPRQTAQLRRRVHLMVRVN